MRGNPLNVLLKLVASLALPLAFTGCLFEDAGESPGSRSNGVSLSQAMQASASGSREPLHGSGGGEPHTSVDVDVNANTSASSSLDGLFGGIALVSYDDRNYLYQLPVDVAYSVPFNGQIQSLTRFTITPVSFETEHNFLGFFLSGDIVDLKAGSLPDRAINDTWMFELGLAYRYYFTPAHAFVSPYVSVNAALQSLQWDYRNPVNVNGSQITSDSLNGVGGYAGFGVAFNRNSHLSFFGEAGFGGTLFQGQTTQGFNNDVFDNFGYFTVKAGLSIKF
jgi:hypothetical protein